MGALRGEAGSRDYVPASEQFDGAVVRKDWTHDDPDGFVASRYVRDDKVVEGRDGFLFMANDNNYVLAQHDGSLRLTAEEVERWRLSLERRHEYLAGEGCAHIAMVVPNSHSVYPEKLPAGIETAAERPVHQLIAHLERTKSRVRFLFPIEEMTARKDDNLVCARCDSHWTDFGAFVAFRRLLAEASALVPVRDLVVDDLMLADFTFAGDLGYKFDPIRQAPQVFARMRYRHARLVYDNCVDGTGSTVVTRCDVAPPTTCLLLGDSYGYQIAKFLAESFQNFVFVHAPELDPGLIEAVRPDIVITMLAERFLIAVPGKAKERTLGERERRKRDNNRRRLPALHWTWPPPISLWPVERMRARLIAQRGTWDAALVSALAYAGLRPREVGQLRWSAIGPDEITVEPSPTPVTEDHPRRVPLFAPVAADLEAWRAESGGGGEELVFWEPGRQSTITWREWNQGVYQPLAREFKLEDRSPAKLSDIFCLLLINAGADAERVSELSGIVVEDIRAKFGNLFTDRFVTGDGSEETDIMLARAGVLRAAAGAGSPSR